MKSPRKYFSNSRSSASAGSGKTYSLTGRFIALALEEDDPSSIIALTFTRKSAGEFLGEILKRTAAAAASDAGACELSKAVCGDAAEYTRSDFLALLHRLVNNLNRLKLSTIDSFCSSLLGAFAEDFGMFSEISVMDSFTCAREISAARERVFRKSSVDDRAFANFAQLVKKATFGQEEKSLSKKLSELVDASRKWLWLHPNIDEWGNKNLFPDVNVREWNQKKYDELLLALCSLEAKYELEKLGLGKFFGAANWLRLPAAVPTSVSRLAEVYRENGLILPNVKIKYSRKEIEIPSDLARAISEIFEILLAAHIGRICSATRSLAEIADAFEKEYARSVRARGKLVFDDIPKILSSSEFHLQTLLMQQRLDSKFKHWMFDEFQDTSRLQWTVFENIIDEAVCDETHTRSFFYVGDIKQSIYSWRGGDFRLFGEIFARYSRMGVMHEGERLVKSWRSGVNVISLVNAMFSNSADLAEVFTPKSADVFCSMFSEHESAVPQKKSYIELSLTPRAAGRSSDELRKERFAVWEGVYKILKKINPPAISKSCAVLLHKNDSVEELVGYLRKRSAEESTGLSVAGELEMHIADSNMIVPPFIQIIQALAHPTDTASVKMVGMTPFAKFTRGFDETFRAQSREIIAEKGYGALFKRFKKFICDSEESSIAQLDEFSLAMLARLEDACAEFDKNFNGGDDAFISFLREKTFRSGTAENTVQIMTVHKSKGLGFDMVILPDLHKSAGASNFGICEVCSGEFGVNEKYLGMYIRPQSAVCELHPLLKSNAERLRDADSFEDICALYVAVTRAKNAVYVVMPELTEKSLPPMKSYIFNSFNFIGATQISAGIYGLGDGAWYETNSQKKSFRPKLKALAIPAICPSIVSQRASELSVLQRDSADFGSLVHALLSRIEGENYDIESLCKTFATKYAPAVLARAVKIVKNLLQSAAGQKVFFEHKDMRTFVEMSFDTQINSQPASGVIDRLQILEDNGGIAEAIIIDFKSITTSASERYGDQLAFYAEAVKKLFKPKIIRTFILGYSDCNLVEINTYKNHK